MAKGTSLVVEDHPLSRELVVDLLMGAGYTVLQAGDAVGLLKRVKQERPFLIPGDLRLPAVGGFTLASQFKADRETRGICILATTASARPEDKAWALEAGCGGYLTKPLDMLDPVQTVSRLLAR